MNKIKAMKLFKKYCKKYITKFGLTNFEYHFQWDDNEGRRAAYEGELLSGQAYLTLSENWIDDNDLNLKELEKVAFHEVCEALLAQLRSMADEHFNVEKVDKEIHRVIRRLENLFFGII